MRPWRLPMRNPNFTGREQLLSTLEARLTFQALDNLKPVTITVCNGLGGMGKTQIAVEFAHKYRSRFRFVTVIPAESAEHVQSAYLQLAQDLGILSEKTHPEEVVKIICRCLNSQPGNLVIFDGAPNYLTIERFIPPTGCAVLITSRVTHGWPEEPLTIPVFSKEEARIYVKRILGERLVCSDEDINTLGREVGWLPLAFASATAYIWMQKITIREYLRLLEEAPRQLLSNASMPSFDTHVSVYLTFELAIRAIERECHFAREVLDLSSFFHCSDIPAFLFCSELMPLNHVVVEEAIGLLNQYSLITIDSRYRFTIYPLIHDLLLKSMEDAVFKKRFFEVGKIVAEYGTYFAYEDLKDFAMQRALFLHFLSYASIGESIGINIQFLEGLVLLLADAAQKHEEYRPFHKPLQKFLCNFVHERYGPEHPKSISELAHLGIAYAESNPRLAYELLEKAYIAQGSEHEDYFTLLSFGQACIAAGEHQKGICLMSRGLAILREKGSPPNEDHVKVLMGLGGAYLFCDDLESARDIFLSACSISESIFHHLRHPYVASSRIALGETYFLLDKELEGMKLIEEALPFYIRYIGSKNSSIDNLLSELGRLYKKIDARLIRCELLEKLMRVLESNFLGHPTLAYMYRQLSFAYGELNHHAEACELIDKAYHLTRQCRGSIHPETAVALNDAAVVYALADRNIEACKLLSQAHTMLLEHPDAGPDDERTRIAGDLLLGLNALAGIDSVPKSTTLLQSPADQFWQKSPQSAEEFIRLAIKYEKESNQSGQIACLIEALKLSPYHPAANYQMAKYLFEMKNYTKAIACIEMSLKNEPNAKRHLFSYKLKARIFLAIERYDLAEESVRMILSIEPDNAEANELIEIISAMNFQHESPRYKIE